MLRGDKKRGEYYEEESKRESKYRLLSDLERYEIFNTEEAEKYDTQQALDFIIDDKIALEIKSGNNFFKRDIDQLFSYIKSANLKLGILVNFTSDGVKSKRILNIRNYS